MVEILVVFFLCVILLFSFPLRLKNSATIFNAPGWYCYTYFNIFKAAKRKHIQASYNAITTRLIKLFIQLL